jgi:acyl carrier protein
MSNVTTQQILDVIDKANLVKDIDALEHDKPLNEQGVDSLDFSGVLFNIEEEFDIEIPDEDIGDLQTINSILSYVNDKK